MHTHNDYNIPIIYIMVTADSSHNTHKTADRFKTCSIQAHVAPIKSRSCTIWNV